MKSDYFPNQMFLPVSLNITNKKVLIIGGGKVAAHKLSTLLKFTTNITILAPDITEQIKNDRRLNFIQKKYEKKDLLNFHLVYACTNDRQVNVQIKHDANSLNLLVNVADDPELCDFISPAIYKNENLTISVGSNAKDVKRAISLRDRIKERFENGGI